MSKTVLHVAIIQENLIWESPEQNKNIFAQKINNLPQNTDLVVLPELFTTGFTMNVSLAETMQGDTVLWMQNMAKSNALALVGSIIIFEDNKYYNRLLFVHPDGRIEYYNKHHLFTLANENKVFTAGAKRLIVNYKNWKICPLICYDLRFPIWSNNTVHYDVLLYVASWPTKRICAWDALLKARAIENMSYTIGVNRVGQDGNGFDYCGHSQVLDTLGNKMVQLKPNNSAVKTVQLFKQKQNSLRETLGFLKDKD